MVVADCASDAPLTGFVAEYTTKDLILYALAVGFGSSENDQDDDLRYLFELHSSFSAVPTFSLVLPFWADQSIGISAAVKPFPPPMMKAMGVLPKQFLRTELPADLPVIHTSQTITWHRPIPIPTGDSPIQTNLTSRILSVVPKSVGTFVTSETQILSSGGSLLSTLESTSLLLGVPPKDVIPCGRPNRKRQRHSLENHTLVFEWTYRTVPTQALLYRMASGDSNIIHVDSSSVSLVGTSKRPLLHGLCTLGIALRVIMKYLRETGGDFQFTRLEADFTKPAFVSDCLTVRIWKEDSQDKTFTHKVLLFKVLNFESDDVVVDNGAVTVNQIKKANGQARARL